MTPMQEQYNRIKAEYKDAIVLFRLGDFYEAFNDDAITLSKVLGITLTGRGKDEKRSPMAGIPHHALPTYLPKMVEAELKVAIADQVEEPQPGKLVERKVTKLITPGTIFDENSLDSSKNNFLASVFSGRKGNYALVYCDVSTGELTAFQTTALNLLKIELSKLNPSEIICSTDQLDEVKRLTPKRLEPVESSRYDYKNAYVVLTKQFNVKNLKGFGIEDDKEIVAAAGALIDYLHSTQKTDLKHIVSIKQYDNSSYMKLDSETIRNLELIYPMNSTDQNNTLLGVLNRCENPMGKRKLRTWILNPLIKEVMLQERLDCVDFFFATPILTHDIREVLNQMGDLERIIGRIGVGSANAKDVVALKFALELTQKIIDYFNAEQVPTRLAFLLSNLKNEKLKTVIDLIQTALLDEPSALLTEGGMIREGYNSNVDELRSLRKNSKMILATMQKDEIERTKISSLKISYNNVFGYYIEVTRTHLDKVPEHYIRKQTLANAERFITQELKELEVKILSAEEQLVKLEQELFLEVRAQVAEFADVLLEIAAALAELDVLTTFGFIARTNNYVKPKITTEKTLTIEKGRHAVVEQLVEDFTANSVSFSQKNSMHILTGPNMSGKSTFIRQVALLVLMTQIGSFVPAEKMNLGLVDRVFTRVGASDNLSKGESTFMVEMSETANILNNATEKSLIILDEVGRGTSTYDGVAIAWSIIEFIVEKVKAKTLFATHYHELIELEKRFRQVENYNVEVLENKGKILFKHKIIKGGTNKSYGIHVAELAGIPTEVTKKAELILKQFEASAQEPKKAQKKKNQISSPRKINPEQLGLI